MSPQNTFRNIVSHYNWQLFLCSGLLTLSSANFGFDNQGFSQTQAMTVFTRRFGECHLNAKTGKQTCAIPSYFLSFLNGFPFLAFPVGTLVGSEISARFGRRWTVFLMSLWAMVAASIVISAKERNQLLVGRCLNHIYIGMELSVIPVFQSELMPKEIRGFAVGSYQMSFSIGGIIMSIVAHFTSQLKTDVSWRVPFGLFFVVPSIVASLVWFIPESPRFLISKGRREEATKALTRIRVNNSPDDIEQEIQFIELGLAAHENQEKGGYLDLFKGTSRRRTLVTMGSCFFLQWTGQSFSSQYGAIFVKSLNSVNPFNFTIIQACVNWIATLLAMVLTETAGRRYPMIGGIAGQATFMMIIGGLGLSKDPSDSAKTAIVVCVVLFAFCYNIGWAPMNWIMVAEISDQKLRDKNQRVGAWVNILSNFIVTFTLPYLLDAPSFLGSKVGFIYGSFGILGTIFGFFFIPELKGRSPEEINLLFDLKISAIRSSSWSPENLAEELRMRAKDHGEVVEEADEKAELEERDERGLEYTDNSQKV